MIPSPSAAEAVVFDAFGTLVRRLVPSDAYRRLWDLRDKRREGLDVQLPMRRPLALRDVAEAWGAPLEGLRPLELSLKQDTLAVLPYEEAWGVVDHIRRSGRKVVLCSNLALPYAEPLMRQFRGMVHTWMWSFDTGAIKPEPAMFEAVMEATGLPPAAHVMVGDRWQEDVLGPRTMGWQAVQVIRPGQPGERGPDAWRDLRPLLSW